MKQPLRVLLVGNSEDDVEPTLLALQGGDFECTWRLVQGPQELAAALATGDWDAVIADCEIPGFSGFDALRLFRATELDIPFVLVSATSGEHGAVSAMKEGASDYVLKGSLERLAPALDRELKETQTRADNRRARNDLRESELRFRQVAENIRDVFMLTNADGHRVLYASPAYERIWGRSCASLYADAASWCEAVHPEDQEYARSSHKAGMAKGSFQFSYRLVDADGSIRWMEVSGFPVRDDTGAIVRIASIVYDVTERSLSEERIRRLNRVYAMLSGINALTVRVRDRDVLFREACALAVQLGGFLMAWIGVLDKSGSIVMPTASAGMSEDLFKRVRDRCAHRDVRLPGSSLLAAAVRNREATYINDLNNTPGLTFKDELIARGVGSIAILPLQVGGAVIAVFTLYATEAGSFDETEHKLLEQLAGDIAYSIDHIDQQAQLEYLAYYDVLTGLANRRLFLERLAQFQRGAMLGGHKLAMYLLDIERFKNISDSLGTQAGDLLLRQVAYWLVAHTGDASQVARVGADHFAVVLPESKGAEEAARLLDRMIREFQAHEFHVNDAVLRVALKAGVALFPDDGTSADILFRNAEAALKKAKASGDGYLFYTQKMTDAVSGQLALENALHHALADQEFVLYYQPKVNLATGKVTSAEALIRWNDPKSGIVPPGQFIPILEETGLIHEVGRWALRQALCDYLRWRRAGLPAVRIAVNVSPLQLRNRGFIDEIREVLSIDPDAAAGLELEITESVIMEDVDYNIGILNTLRAMGVTIAIDDFGTGYSSLGQLARLPMDALKIDRVFVVEMTAGTQGLALVSAIITLARSLNLKVVAEGVETREQADLLRQHDCDEMQGFLFSRAVPAEAFEANFLSRGAATS